MKNLFFILLIAISISGCSSSQKTEEPIDSNAAEIGLDVIAGDCDDTGDPLTIDSLEFDRENLRISVGHSGGCEKHSYTLIKCENILASEPPQFAFGLRHNANGDSCEAFLTTVLEVPKTKIPGLSKLEGIDGQKFRLSGE